MYTYYSHPYGNTTHTTDDRTNHEDQRFGFAFLPFIGGLAGGLLGSALVSGPGYGYKQVYNAPYPVPYPMPYPYPVPYPYNSYYYPTQQR
ncbi:hypothetical protein SFC66_12950 [Terribacillus saccharophilus]|uniref:hypothetical protein n=1 Tax=Terribacillus saccharophilus TaxID=361277 RepID=UPI003981D652